MNWFTQQTPDPNIPFHSCRWQAVEAKFEQPFYAPERPIYLDPRPSGIVKFFGWLGRASLNKVIYFVSRKKKGKKEVPYPRNMEKIYTIEPVNSWDFDTYSEAEAFGLAKGFVFGKNFYIKSIQK